jgi:hypothetical protein
MENNKDNNMNGQGNQPFNNQFGYDDQGGQGQNNQNYNGNQGQGNQNYNNYGNPSGNNGYNNQNNPNVKKPKKGMKKIVIPLIIIGCVGIVLMFIGFLGGARSGVSGSNWFRRGIYGIERFFGDDDAYEVDDDYYDDDDGYYANPNTNTNNTTNNNTTGNTNNATNGAGKVVADVATKSYTIDLAAPEDIASIDIDVDAAAVTFKEATNNQVKIECGTEVYDLLSVRSPSEANGILKITSPDREFHWTIGSINNDKYKMVVYIPKTATNYNNFEVSLDAGSFKSDVPIKSTRVDFDVDAAKIDVSDLVTNSLEASVDAGSISIGRVSKLGKNADVLLRSELDVDAGSIKVGYADAENSFNGQVKADIGSIKYGSKSYSGLSRRDTITGNGTNVGTISAEVDAGSINISFGR